MDIKIGLETVKKSLPTHVQLVVVSKMQPPESIMRVYNAGHRVFGENKVQELSSKQPIMPSDISWHFIGHLQRNKVKYIAPFVALIHSVDSFKLLKEIDKEAQKNQKTIDCLLEFHIAKEESKHGLTYSLAEEMLTSNDFKNLKNVRICGVMGMATFTDDVEVVRNEFKLLKDIFETLKKTYFSDNSDFKEISMGMSDDFLIAVDQGSTIVRIGSAIFK